MEKEYKLNEKQFLEMLKVIEDHKEWKKQNDNKCKDNDNMKRRARGRHGCY